ncbi:small ribosomal subunit protein uS11 [Linepithema humile]|uniref:small ribosomal subunit protein uS11 n=1 Tax=Linepithema humile TaxID=83485 RepID=UPI00062335F7|nr:PREDICTED: 30S ribosomal protein S11, chloroplastic [Linepithema humile]
MIKSVLRLIKFPALTECALADSASLSARLNTITLKNICTTSLCNKEIRLRSEKIKVGKNKYDGVAIEGEDTSMFDASNAHQQQNLFPDANTPNRLFNGVPFKELYIVNIKSTPNNTIMSLSEHDGKVVLLHSAGVEGFKNARKGTNIAAQQAAITFANRVLEYGVNTVRIRVQGIGPGRMSSIKGLHMTGVNIVSITDDTRVSYNPPRPRKQRRI